MDKDNAIEVKNITKDFKVYYDKGSELKEKMLFWKRMAWSRWTGRLNRKAGSESDYKMNLLEVRDSGKYIFNNNNIIKI